MGPGGAVCHVAETSLSGLNAEADTVEEFVRILPGMIQDLLEEDGMRDAARGNQPLSLEVTAHTTTLLHRDAA